MDEEHINWNECPDVNILREFIDIDAWIKQTPESLKKRYPFAQVTKASVAEYDCDDDDEYDLQDYSIYLNVPQDVLVGLIETLEGEGWDVYTDDAELVDGWYEDVYLNKTSVPEINHMED